MTRTIQEQLNDASRHLAAMTRDLGFKHPDRLAVLEVVRELQAERKRREETTHDTPGTEAQQQARADQTA